MNKERLELFNKIFFWLFLVVLVGFTVHAFIIGSNYIWDYIVLIGLLVVVYVLRRRLFIHPGHFFLFNMFLVLHSLGVFGFYSNYFLGVEFDTYVHGYFGLVGTLILSRIYDHVVPSKNKKLKFVALITVILGISAFHEILEYLGGAFLGEGMGFLKAGAGDVEMWDTQTDMRNNLLGSLVAMGYHFLKSESSKKD
jgi:uncharacterized membrane protein YjdF